MMDDELEALKEMEASFANEMDKADGQETEKNRTTPRKQRTSRTSTRKQKRQLKAASRIGES